MTSIRDQQRLLMGQHKANRTGGGYRTPFHDDLYHQTKSCQPQHKGWMKLFMYGWEYIDGELNLDYDPKVGKRVTTLRVDEETGETWDFSKTKMTNEIIERELTYKGGKSLSISLDGVCQVVYVEIRAIFNARHEIDPLWKDPDSIKMSKRSDLDFELLKALFPEVKGVAKKEVSKTEAQVN